MALNPNPITPGTPISAKAGAANGAAGTLFEDDFVQLLVESILDEDIYADGVGNDVKKMVAEAALQQNFQGMTSELLSSFFRAAINKQRNTLGVID